MSTFSNTGLLDGGNSVSYNNQPSGNSTGILGGVGGYQQQPQHHQPQYAPSEMGTGLLKAANINDALSQAQTDGFNIGLPPNANHYGLRMKVTKLLIFKTGQYQQQYLRPVQAQANVNVESVFADITNDGTVLSNANLSKVAGAFMQPTTHIGQQNTVHVDNGWGTPRMRFMMIIDDDSIGTNGVRYYVSGFFDHSEHVSHAGNFNPAARMYITRTIEMTAIQQMQGGVMNLKHHVNNAVNLMSSVHYQGGKYKHMRPQDIFGVLSSLKNSHNGVMVDDLRISLSSRPRSSNIQNDSMAMFLNNSMQAAREVIAGEYRGVDHLGSATQSRDENIRGSLNDPTIVQLRPLSMISHQSEWEMKGYIEWRELAALFPEINTEQVTVLQTYNNVRGALPTAGQSEQFNTGWSEGIHATVITQELPPLMMDYMLTRIAFTVDGFTIDPVTRQPLFIPELVHAFDQKLLHPQHIESFKNQVLSVVYPRISHNGLAPVRFRIDMNIYGDARVAISTNPTGEMVPFVVPMFAVNTFLSLITPNSNDIHGIANAINTMTGVLEESAAQQHGAQFNWQSN